MENLIVKELKEIIKDLPDNCPVLLVDLKNDHWIDGNYRLTKESLSYSDIEDVMEEPAGKGLIMCFDNHFNTFLEDDEKYILKEL